LEVRFSGVIPAYNHERFIYSAISSLAEQVDELVVVDDNSSDKTWMEIERAKLDFPNVRSFRNTQKLGVSGCVNRAVEMTNGEILIFLGSDDEALPGRVQRQAQIVIDPRVSIAASMPEVIGETGLTLTRSHAPEFVLRRPHLSVASQLVFEGNFVCSPSIAMRKSVWNKLSGYRLGLPNLHDLDFVLRATSHGEAIISPEPVIRYRKHANNLSSGARFRDQSELSFMAAESDFIFFSYFNSLNREKLIQVLSVGWLNRRMLSRMSREEILDVAFMACPFVRDSPTPTRKMFESLSEIKEDENLSSRIFGELVNSSTLYF
jgi:glycosyltransferase involved in cell wall biosynthesis